MINRCTLLFAADDKKSANGKTFVRDATLDESLPHPTEPFAGIRIDHFINHNDPPTTSYSERQRHRLYFSTSLAEKFGPYITSSTTFDRL
jgi:hypothetical protein